LVLNNYREVTGAGSYMKIKRETLVYIGKRILLYLLTIWGAFTISFFFFRLIPGDPIQLYFRNLEQQYSSVKDIPPEAYDSLRQRIGIDGTVFEQYVKYLRNAASFDLGPSFIAFPTPVQVLIGRALPWTMGLLGLSLLISWTLGVVIGGVAGWLRGSVFSRWSTLATIALSQIPQYILAVLFIFVFALIFNLLPARDPYPANVTPGFTWEFVGGVIQHGILPALAIITVSLAGWILSTRSLMVSILGEDYLLFAEAKGLDRTRLFFHYAMRNALLPQVTGLAISLGFIINGSLLVELLFNYPGVGSLLAKAIAGLDYNLIQGIVLLSIISVLTANLLLDLILPFIDPRIQRES
jgi:peptide/nickel transport system permease protein